MPEITYTGHTAVPSDYECADGQLALSLNLINENGSLQPLFSPSIIFTLPTDYKVAYIHKTTDFTHYIITRKDNIVNIKTQAESGEITTNPSIYYIDEKNAVGDKSDINDTDYIPLGDIDGTEITAIQAVGNTLIIVTNEAMNYYLWKTDEDNYSYYAYLGTHLPELDLSFGLQGEVWREADEDHSYYSDDLQVTIYYGFEVKLAEELEESELYEDLSDANKATVTEQVLAHVNKYIADYSTNKGRFLYPFFVRYAYRLYDGSLTMHSAPILMLTNTVCAPTVFICRFTGSGSKYDTLDCSVLGVTHSIDYRIESISNYEQLRDNWGDIVKSVDMFVSAPLYNYDQSGEIERFVKLPVVMSPSDESGGYSVCRPFLPNDQIHDTKNTTYSGVVYNFTTPFLWENTYDEGVCLDNYCRITTEMLLFYSFQSTTARVELPTKSEDTIKEEIRSCCNFYLLKSINVENLAEYDEEGKMLYSRIKVEVAEDFLQSLVNRELMTDDYDSHDTILAKYAYGYNSRLNLANITKKLYHGYTPSSLFCYGNGYAETENEDQWAIIYDSSTTYFLREAKVLTTQQQSPCTLYTYIKQDNKTIITKSESDNVHSPITYVGGKFLFVYYPNTNAYKAIIDIEGGYGAQFEVKLEPHDFLNGAFYFGGWSNPETLAEKIPQATTDQIVLVANKIYNSEINNPFFFPVENIATVGTGTILGIATAAKALSQGQFGSFPLYAFCDDGVWALSVSSEGVYSAVQPITRDKCINPKAITQLDTSVLFPTDRGIMQISGSDTACFTDILNGQNTFDITTLPAYDELLALAGHNEITIRPIYELLEKCIIIYDYTNQHIYVCDDEEKMAYVISSKSNAWGMAAVDIQSTVNSYPEAYAMSGDNFVDFSHPDKTNPQNCFLITRPLKLEDPNAFKTVTAVIQRGYFNKEHIQTALYGSRDLMHWHLVRSSTSYEIRAFAGTPYKYFRIATLAQLQKDEAIFGATVNAIKRFTNKER